MLQNHRFEQIFETTATCLFISHSVGPMLRVLLVFEFYIYLYLMGFISFHDLMIFFIFSIHLIV